MTRSKAVEAIEARLDAVPPGSERADVLEAARQFKNNWVALGEKLARVLDRKEYEAWGYDSFDRYVTAELRLKRETAYKLVRSFTFVRSEKPEYLAPEQAERLPAVDVIDFLSKKREAEELPPRQLQSFTDQAFEQSWTPRTIGQKWRDLVTDERKEVVEDKSLRAVRRARELASRLSKALLEIPGVDATTLDAAQRIVDSLQEVVQ